MKKLEIVKLMLKNNYKFAGEVSGDTVNENAKYADCAYYDKYLTFKKDGETLFINSYKGALGRRIIRIFENGSYRTYATDLL
jgi:hypothetical protein